MRPRRSVAILSLSRIADDPRVRRQGDALAAAGWDVEAFGLEGAASEPPAWPVRAVVGPAARPSGLSPRLAGAALSAAHRVGVSIGVIDAAFHSRAYGPSLRAMAAAAERSSPDVWLANDWPVLPLAARLAATRGGTLAYDTHELAAEEYSQNRLWRLMKRPGIIAAEGTGIRSAALVTCVSDGIAARLQDLYALGRRPVAVRNVPDYQAVPFRPCGARIRVLYHGILAPGRGLEASIDALALLQDRLDMTLRGPGPADYVASLRQRAERLGLGNRIAFAPPVPTAALVTAAAPFDVGLLALPGHSEHNRLALPNKVFEYLMAGLALCVSALPEMAALVTRHGVGTLVPSVDAKAIATALGGLDPDRINTYKRNALAAAHELCWERERDIFVNSLAEIAGRAEDAPVGGRGK